MNLTDKVIVITGGGQGLGRSIALNLAKNGAKLALIDLNEESLKETVALVEQAGSSAKYYLANVTNENEVMDGTDPFDGCFYNKLNQEITNVSVAWGLLDCDGDGLNNGEELTGVDDPATTLDPAGNTSDPLVFEDADGGLQAAAAVGMAAVDVRPLWTVERLFR